MSGFRFHHIGLLVTGDAELVCLPQLLGGPLSRATGGRCAVQPLHKVPQLRARDPGGRRAATAIGTSKALPTRDEEIALHARRFLDQRPDGFVLLVDDEEHTAHQMVDGRSLLDATFERYRTALDRLLGARAYRVGVYFLREMLEAYYFAQPNVVRSAIGVTISAAEEDVEAIRNPKRRLQDACKAVGVRFHEKEHGARIISALDLSEVLARPHTCQSLRALMAWCVKAIGAGPGPAMFALDGGSLDPLTGAQLSRLP